MNDGLDAERDRRLPGLARAAGLMGVGLGLSVLVGWWGDVAALRAPIPNTPEMRPNTALMFSLAGVALWLRARDQAPWLAARAGSAAALVGLGIAAATLFEHAAGAHLGIDDLLSSGRGGLPPSPSTAAAFLLLFAALLAPRSPSRRWGALVEGLALVAASSAMLALLGYALEMVFFTAPWLLPPKISMAAHTAAGLLVLAAGVLLARRDAALTALLISRSSGGEMARRLLLVALVTIPAATLGAFALQQLGWWPSPGAAAVAATASALVLVLALRFTGRRLDSVEEERARLAAELRSSHQMMAEVVRANLVVAEAAASMPDTGLPRVLEVVAEEARTITDAELAGVGLGASVPFEHFVHVGAAAERADALGAPLLAAAVAAGTLVRVANVREDPRLRACVPAELPVTSFMSMPVEYRGRVTGHLCLANKRGGTGFTEQDQSALELLAAHLGAAVETSRLYQREAIERARLQSIVAQMPVGVVVIDANARLVLQNQVSLDMAKSRDPVVHDVRLPSGEPVPVDEYPVMRALRGEHVVSQDLLVELPGGERVPILASAVPVRSGDELVGAVAVFRDIRALKALERLREEWASVIAHDMRQPLNTIWLNSDLLNRARLPERQQNQLDRIRRSVARLNRMIEDLLDMSRLESHRLALSREPLRLGTVVDEALAGVPALADRSRVALDDPELLVHADPVRVQQVLENLLSNAVKYGDPTSAVVVRSLRQNEHVTISVENLGAGIPADEIGTLFARFSRTRSASSGAATGLGLGLYICRGLVEAHGGRMWVESEPGSVTAFHFTLPLAAEAAAARTEETGAGAA